MGIHRRAFLWAVLCSVPLSSCGRCASQPSDPRIGEFLPVDERMSVQDGVEDVKNRFAFAVIVSASVKAEEALKCTGVLLSPRLVLTAGHCVCERRKSTDSRDGTRFLIDGARCAEQVSVTRITYHTGNLDPSVPPGFRSETYYGKVKVHPDLKVVLNQEGGTISSKADVAVALLERPVEDASLPVRISDSEVNAGETIYMAGYGYDATTDLIYGVRRFGHKRVKSVPMGGSDNVLLEAHGGAFTTGSGEPCLRQEGAGVALVGVSGKMFGSASSCTSLDAHRAWLSAELRGM
jgi:hypothetical protein